MTTKATRRLVNVAIGIGAAGVFGINIATRVIQSRCWNLITATAFSYYESRCLTHKCGNVYTGKHRKQDYCAIPLRLAQENKKCVQLLGGGDMKIKNLNLKTVVLTETEFKVKLLSIVILPRHPQKLSLSPMTHQNLYYPRVASSCQWFTPLLTNSSLYELIKIYTSCQRFAPLNPIVNLSCSP